MGFKKHFHILFVDDDPFTCDLLGSIIESADQPAIDIEKATNGEDADQPTGPVLEIGQPVTWTYVVTNTGTVTLSDVTVNDDIIGPVSCPQDTLAPGASMTSAPATPTSSTPSTPRRWSASPAARPAPTSRPSPA